MWLQTGLLGGQISLVVGASGSSEAFLSSPTIAILLPQHKLTFSEAIRFVLKVPNYFANQGQRDLQFMCHGPHGLWGVQVYKLLHPYDNIMAVSVDTTLMNYPGDVIIFRTITWVNKICIIRLVLLHHAHGDVVEVTDLFIGPSSTDSRYYCFAIDYMCYTRHSKAGYPKLSVNVQSFLPSPLKG